MIQKLIKLFILTLFLFLGEFLVPSVTLAQSESVPSEMLNVQISELGVHSGTISIPVKLSNQSSKNMAESFLVAKLISPGLLKTITANGQKINIQGEGQLIEFSKSEFFPIKPGDSISQSMTITYPQAIKPGKYKIMVEVLDKDGTSQGFSSQEVALTGTDSFLEITPANCKLKIGDKSYNTVEGPNVEKDQVGILNCTVKNNTNKIIQTKPQVVYGINSVSQSIEVPKSIPTAATISIGPGQFGSIAVNLPKDLSPQVYEGLLTFVDPATSSILSPAISFRWIMTGASAVINNLDLDKSYYKIGDTAKISISALPSVDLSWRGKTSSANPNFSSQAGTDLKKPKLVIKITNDEKKVCGETEQLFPSTQKEIYWEDLKLDVPISIECKNPQVEAAVYEEGMAKPLTVLVKGMVTTNTDLKLPPQKTPGEITKIKNNFGWLIIFVVIVLIAVVLGYIIWKKKRRKTPPGSSSPSSPVKTPADDSDKSLAMKAIIVILSLGWVVFGNWISLGNDFFEVKAQEFSPITGVAKPPVNNSDASTQTVTMRKSHERRVQYGPGPRFLQWANVRDFAENNTGGDSRVTVSPDCKSITVTVNGTVGSDYMCANWGPGIAIANFVDQKPSTPTDISSLVGNQVVIPSLQIAPAAFNNYAAYGSHIVNVHNYGTAVPKSITYSLKFPDGLTEGQHKLLLQAGVSQTTFHGSIDRYYSSLEPVIDGPEFIPGDVNCDGTTPCFINLEKTFSCGPPPACGTSCTTKAECEGAKEGCVECRPDETGKTVCQKPPVACNAACATDKDCFGNKDGCSSCLPNDSGSGTVCRKPSACGVSCTRNDQCAGAKDGCTECRDGSCKKPPACGDSCTTKADCAGAKDGCSDCLEGTCTDFKENMCKCDGIDSVIKYPSDKFDFTAYAKVMGADAAKAQVQSMQIFMAKDNTVIAKSSILTPTIAETTAEKTRYKISWSVPPPSQIDPKATYRVWADIKCKAKKRIPNPSPVTLGVTTNDLDKGRGIFSQILDYLSRITGVKSSFFKKQSLIGAQTVYAASAPSPSVKDNLQLDTLQGVTIVETDSCRFVNFKFDEALF